jgi:hypothetical protein
MRFEKEGIMQWSKPVEESFKLYRRAMELSYAHQKAVEGDRELRGTLLGLGYAAAEADWVTLATTGMEDFDLRLRRALRFLRG